MFSDAKIIILDVIHILQSSAWNINECKTADKMSVLRRLAWLCCGGIKEYYELEW